MDNILPTAPRGDTPNHKLSNLGAWNPEKADGTNPNNIPYGLGVTTFDPAVDNRFVVNEPPVNEPNKRDLRPIYHAHDPSPLSAEMRGQAAVGKISLPDVNDDDSNPIYKPPRPKPESDEVILSIFNLSKSLMDTFIQRAGSIKSFGLKPRMQRQHNITAKASSKKEKDGFAQAKPVSILFGSPTQLSVVMSGRHEIRTVDFQPGPIGMEVEDVLNRLMCTRLLPDSQAEPHAYLVDAEIIAINGFRVITLDEFREEVTCSQRKGKVSIMCVCYRKGKTKIDGFYAQLVAQRKNVKSLFSGLLAGGLDSDHQHDISLTESDNKDDDDEEDSDEDEEEGGGAEAKAEGKEVDSLDEEAEEETDAKADAKESHARHSDRNGSKSMDDKDTKGFYDEEGDEEEEGEEEEEKKAAELSSDEDSDDDHEANTTSIRKKRVDYSHKMEKDGDEEEELMVIAKGHRNVPAAVDDMDSDLGFMDFAEEKEAVEEKGTDVIDEEQEGSEEDVDQVPIDNLALSSTTTVSEVLDTWDYATALDVEETVPFSRMVCVPPLFRKSIVSRTTIVHITIIPYP